MSKQTVSEMQWTEAELAELPLENGFRMRGLETTRLDTLIDAAFAFVLSFLVMLQGRLPTNFPELLEGIKLIPALAMSFLILMMFWLEHRRWSRRFAIESKVSVFLSVTLVFVLLVYILPLRLLFQGMFHFLSDGFFPQNFTLDSEFGARGFFAFYSAGFFVMTLIVAAMYRIAIQRKQNLLLSKKEYFETVNVYFRWLIASAFAILSLLFCFILPITYLHWAGFVYFGLFPIQYLQYKISERKQT